jgi:hypothetical protein
VSGIYVRTLHLPVALDTNNLAVPPTSVVLANGQTVNVPNWNTRLPNPLNSAPCAGANIVLCFANPLLLQNDVYSSAGSAQYMGGILEVRKRFSNHFSMMGSYTYSKAIDTTTDFNSDYGPMDMTNLRAERGLSGFDQRHKIVFSSVIQSPCHNWFMSGMELSPIISYNSGHPFNLLAGSDVNGDRHSTNDRPVGGSRNTGTGPSFFTWDMRLSKEFHFGEKAGLTLIAESFNLLNRTNYSGVNDVAGSNFSTLPGFTTFRVPGKTSFLPNSPLAFTSDFNRRQFQLGARITF